MCPAEQMAQASINTVTVGAAPEQYQSVIELVYNEGRTFVHAEREVLGYALPMAKWGQTSARELAGQFQDPLFRRAFPYIFG